VLLDASILVAWFLDEKAHPPVEAAFDTVARVETHTPNLVHYEIRNALLMSERRNRITEAMSARSFAISRCCPFDWSLREGTRAF
jgi:predicted nucleic acid-binding protein